MISQLAAIRGALSLWVVCFHFIGRPFAPADLGPLQPIVDRGYLGVDAFFLLSGLIIAHTWVSRGGQPVTAFLWARLARIYPAHLAVLVLFGVALALTGGQLVGTYDLPSLVSTLLLVDAWGVNDQLAWNYPSWSISAEWFAYLLAPTVFLRLLDVSRAVAVPVASAAAAILALADTSLVTGLAGWTDERALLRISAEFTIGVVIVGLVEPGSGRRPGLLAVGVGLFVVGLWGGLDVLVIAGTAVALAALYAWPSMSLPRWTISLGVWSYAIYLVHALVQVSAEAIVGDATLTGSQRAAGPLLALAVVVVLAAAINRFVEEPARRWLTAHPPRAQPPEPHTRDTRPPDREGTNPMTVTGNADRVSTLLRTATALVAAFLLAACSAAGDLAVIAQPIAPSDAIGTAPEPSADSAASTPPPAPPTSSQAAAPSPEATVTASDAPVTFDVEPLEEVVSTEGFVPYAESNADAWAAAVPQAVQVMVPAADGTGQPAFWVPPIAAGQPLLVALHSWSTPYDQQAAIPFARWAVDSGWGLIAPDFRGVNDDPAATGSDLAVADVIDAVDWALAEGEGDGDRVVAAGYSGGGMMTLLVTARHPDRFAAAIAWGPVVDLPTWYGWNVATHPDRSYVEQIEASCGGPPSTGSAAAADCAARSPSSYLSGAAPQVPTYIGLGISDDIVPLSQGAAAFNALAAPADRIDAADIAVLDGGEVPPALATDPAAEAFFDDDDPPVLATRRSGAVTLVVFDGVHEMLYGPTIAWLQSGQPSGG